MHIEEGAVVKVASLAVELVVEGSTPLTTVVGKERSV